jgi:hypothetical protein
MKLTQVLVEHYDRGIPIEGWENVRKALYLYAAGTPKSGRETRHNFENNLEKVGVLALGMLFLTEASSGLRPNDFVDEMLSEAKACLQTSDNWEEHYDYNGQGYFHKTSVHIEVLDREKELYLLELNAAYVGDKPEAELAEYLGIPRALRYYTVKVQTEPKDKTHFAFDFEKIVRALDGLLKANTFTGKKIVEYFMGGDRYNVSKGYPLYMDDDFRIDLELDKVERRFNYRGGNLIDTWKARGSVLKGLLYASYSTDGPKKLPPSFCLRLSSSSVDRYGLNLPIYDADIKDKLDIKAHAIEDAFKKSPLFEI